MKPLPVCNHINPGDIVAVSDIHATWSPYKQFLDWVQGTDATVVVLGDIVDRGEEDIAVLEATRDRLLDPENFGLSGFHVVMGNHEALFLKVVEEEFQPFRTSTLDWNANGGNIRAFLEMEPHAEWIRELPVYMVIGETLFIHGGLFPGHDPKEAIVQRKTQELLWMRQPFLKQGPKFKRWNPNLKKVVHGHTPVKEPEVKRDRVNIDTGACYKDGYLTAYNVTQNTFKFFK